MKTSTSKRELYEFTENGKRVPKLKGSWQNIYCSYKCPDYSIRCKSGNRDDVLQYICDTHLVEWYTTKLLKMAEYEEDAKDYIQEIYLQLAEQKDEKWQDLYAQGDAAITAFVSGCIIRNVISNSSIAYRRVRKANKNLVHFDDKIWETFDENGEWTLPYELQDNNDNDYNNLIDEFENKK